MVHTFLNSPSNLDVHSGIRFWIFEKKSSELASTCNVHYMATSYSRRGPLRYVCEQTINPTAMICAFLESPTYLNVHTGKRFALFGRNRPNWCRRSRHKKKTTKFALCGRTSYSPAMFSTYLFTFCWHTGDNVRLRDVVKFTLVGLWWVRYALSCPRSFTQKTPPCSDGIM